jgi:adenylosuccinate lyase
LAAVAFGYLFPSARCEILWNERTLPNSAAERIYLPDLFGLVDFMLQRFADTMEKLEVFPAQMERNIWRTGGIVFAQAVMLKLIEKGMSRLQAYKLVEAIALTVEHGTYQTADGKTFKVLVFENQEIRERISEAELNECFDYKFSTRYIDAIFARFEK